MKCALIFLSLVALSYAMPFSFGEGKQVTIDKDGTITILGENGKKIVISRVIGHPGQKDIEISVGGPAGIFKKIRIDDDTKEKTVNFLEPTAADYYNAIEDEDREKRSSKDTKESFRGSKYNKDSKNQKYESQADLLNEIFNEYQGIVDNKSYNNLLAKINSHVQSGDLNEAVYNVLRSLDEYKVAEKLGYRVPVNQPFIRTEYPVNYYPVNSSPFRQGTYSTFDQQIKSYPETRYRGFENEADFQGIRGFSGQPREQFYGQARGQFYGQPRDQFYEKSGSKFFEQPRDQFYEQSGSKFFEQPRDQFYEQSGSKFFEQPRDQFYGRSEGQFYGQARDKFYGQVRDKFYGQPRDQFYGQPRDQFYGQPRDQFYGQTREQTRVNQFTPIERFYQGQDQQQSTVNPSYFWVSSTKQQSKPISRITGIEY